MCVLTLCLQRNASHLCLQEKEMARREKATATDAALAAKQFSEVVRRTNELDVQEAEVRRIECISFPCTC